MLLAGKVERFKILFIPLALLTFVAVPGLFLKAFLPGWILMWVLAFIAFVIFKSLSLLAASQEGAMNRAPTWRSLAIYFASWPEMNARGYFRKTSVRNRPSVTDWLTVTAKTGLGIVTLLWITRNVYTLSPILAGWVGFAGLICFLHFGVFSMLAFAWQSAGIHASPIMNRPATAKSVSEFWNRWNIAFRQIAHAFVFKPAAKIVGIQGAMLLTFLFSGLLHDLMISFPAGGGYGLPTVYFLIQSGGVFVERSAIGGRVLRGYRGRFFAGLIVVAPVPLLFHSLFMMNVILPFLRAIGAV